MFAIFLKYQIERHSMKRPMFSGWRIFFLGLSYAFKAALSKDEKYKRAYLDLADLCSLALVAISAKREQEFINLLEGK